MVDGSANAYDRLDVTIAGGQVGQGVIRLTSGAAVVNGVRDLLLEASEAAGRTLGLPPNSVTMTAEDFLALVELSADAGSFVWQFRIPVEASNLPLRVAGARLDTPPFGRLASSITASWLSDLRGEGVGRSDEPRPEARRTLETTHAVLKALVPAAGNAAVQFSFEWANQPHLEPLDARRFSFSQTDVPRLIRQADEEEEYARVPRGGGSHYATGPRERPGLHEYESFTLIGYVEALRRPEITIAGEVFGRYRRVRLTPRPRDYARAAEAHLSDKTVVAIGTLELRPRSARLRSVEGFDVLDGER